MEAISPKQMNNFFEFYGKEEKESFIRTTYDITQFFSESISSNIMPMVGFFDVLNVYGNYCGVRDDLTKGASAAEMFTDVTYLVGSGVAIAGFLQTAGLIHIAFFAVIESATALAYGAVFILKTVENYQYETPHNFSDLLTDLHHTADLYAVLNAKKAQVEWNILGSAAKAASCAAFALRTVAPPHLLAWSTLIGGLSTLFAQYNAYQIKNAVGDTLFDQHLYNSVKNNTDLSKAATYIPPSERSHFDSFMSDYVASSSKYIAKGMSSVVDLVSNVSLPFPADKVFSWCDLPRACTSLLNDIYSLQDAPSATLRSGLKRIGSSLSNIVTVIQASALYNPQLWSKWVTKYLTLWLKIASFFSQSVEIGLKKISGQEVSTKEWYDLATKLCFIALFFILVEVSFLPVDYEDIAKALLGSIGFGLSTMSFWIDHEKKLAEEQANYERVAI